MTLPTLFDSCVPKPDVLAGTVTEAQFAADLAKVLNPGDPEGYREYREAGRFFANTYPTQGLRDLLWNVCNRLNGTGAQAAAIFRLDTNFGGGKTHALIALVHAAAGMPGVANVREFIDPGLLPRRPVRVAAFDGENADPFNGRPLEPGLRAYTPWGEIAYRLAGREGYTLVRASDEARAAPGADTLRELFGGEPALILLDELALYLRRLYEAGKAAAGGQLSAFLTSLFKAVEGTRDSAVVFTLAIGKDHKATDAYAQENQWIADTMAEAASVASRVATLLNPTTEDETVLVLRRRLFESVDPDRAAAIVDAYRALWAEKAGHLPILQGADRRYESFRAGYPLHPELIETLTEKTATLGTFQRIRGMLRLLVRTVNRLWQERPRDTYAVHLHHIDPAFEPIRQEIVTKLEQSQYLPAIKADVAAVEGAEPALAQQIDRQHFIGLPAYGSFAARTILFHTLAFNESLKGLSPEQLRYSVLSPGTAIDFIDQARTLFVQSSAYLDDRPTAPLRFMAEANLTQIIRRQEAQVDPVEVRNQLNDRIKEAFKSGSIFTVIPFAAGAYEVPDDANDGKPVLVILHYEAADIAGDRVTVPELAARIFHTKGSGSDPRHNRNNLVFLLAEGAKIDEMKRQMVRRLALTDLQSPSRLSDLAEHQRLKLQEWWRQSDRDVAIAIQQCYRHLLYPSRDRIEGAEVELGHTALDLPGTAEAPGNGVKHVAQRLRDLGRLRLSEDEPDSPSYVRDRTPLRKGRITTAELRAEFRKDVSLPILVGDDVFVKGVRKGCEEGLYVYQNGDLILARGLPWAQIKIDEQSFVYTADYARQAGIWPKPARAAADATGARQPVLTGLVPETTGGGSFAPPGGTPPGGVNESMATPPDTAPPPSGVSPAPAETELVEEAVLKEALARLWDRARSKRFDRIARLTLRLFEATDGLRLLAVTGTVPKAEKLVSFDASYTSTAGGELHLEFTGPHADALPVKDFLEAQFRGAPETDLTTTITLNFAGGLDLSGPEPEQLGERLTRLGCGAAQVTATVERAR